MQRIEKPFPHMTDRVIKPNWPGGLVQYSRRGVEGVWREEDICFVEKPVVQSSDIPQESSILLAV